MTHDPGPDPAATPDHPRSRHIPRAGHAVPEIDVLIVDDDPPVRSVMAKVLGAAGYSVTEAEHGLAALDALHTTRFRAIVCDIHMPVVDGVRLFEGIASGFPHLARRVVFVTAIADAPPIAAFLAQTGCLVLNKPYELSKR